MKIYIRTATFLAIMVILGLSAVIPAQAGQISGKAPARPVMMTGQVEVVFETDVNVDNLLHGTSLTLGVESLDRALSKWQVYDASPIFPWRKGQEAIVGSYDMSKFYVLYFPVETDVLSVVDELSKNPYIRAVNPIYAMPMYDTPDDPSFGAQWGMSKVEAPDAWDIEIGSDDAIVAIVDGGVLYSHPDLIDNIWVNPGEDIDGDEVVFDIGDSNAVDDDGNGIADDLIGYDFFTGFSGLTPWPGEDPGTPDIDPNDFNGHGTHCAGNAAAVTNNAIYGAGMAGGWGGGSVGPYRGARIMVLRVGGSAVNPDPPNDEQGYVNSVNCGQGIDYAVKMGACAVNCSWGSSYTSTMQTALTRANDSGVVVVHAAGNEDTYSTSGGYMDNLFIGGYEVALSVAATNSGDIKADFSNFGPYIDVCAPGVNIYNTYSDHYVASEGTLGGTSMSAPFVVGLAALIKSHMPEYDKYVIDTMIKNHAVDIDGINPDYAGYLGSGRIDAYATLENLPVAAFEAGPELVGSIPLTVDFTDLSPAATSWEWDFGDGSGPVFDQNPSHVYNDVGLFDVSLTVEEPKGTATDVLKKLVMITADTLWMDEIDVPPPSSDTQVVLTAYLHNQYLNKSITLPVQFNVEGAPADPTYVRLDSISILDCRTSYFEYKTISPYDVFNNRYGIILRSNQASGSEYLPPGTGAILKMYIFVSSSTPEGTVVSIDTATVSGKVLGVQGVYADYAPEFLPGKLSVRNPGTCGDCNHDDAVNILDIVFLINYKYKDGDPPDPLWIGDVNLDETINILDIVYLINYKYKDGSPPCEPD